MTAADACASRQSVHPRLIVAGLLSVWLTCFVSPRASAVQTIDPTDPVFATAIHVSLDRSTLNFDPGNPTQIVFTSNGVTFTFSTSAAGGFQFLCIGAGGTDPCLINSGPGPDTIQVTISPGIKAGGFALAFAEGQPSVQFIGTGGTENVVGPPFGAVDLFFGAYGIGAIKTSTLSGNLSVWREMVFVLPDCLGDADCSDGQFCNGAETCDANLTCQSGAAPCDDGVACTDDSCDEVNDACAYTPNNAVLVTACFATEWSFVTRLSAASRPAIPAPAAARATRELPAAIRVAAPATRSAAMEFSATGPKPALRAPASLARRRAATMAWSVPMTAATQSMTRVSIRRMMRIVTMACGATARRRAPPAPVRPVRRRSATTAWPARPTAVTMSMTRV